MAYDYCAERKAFMDRLKEWLATEEGRPWRERIQNADDLAIATGMHWDFAEVEFEARHPDLAMKYSEDAA